MKRQAAANVGIAISLMVPALIGLSICIGPHSTNAAPKTCESLAQLVLANTKITAAATVSALTPVTKAAMRHSHCIIRKR